MEWRWLYLQGDGKCLFHSKVMLGHAEVPGHMVGGTRWKSVFIWLLLNAHAQDGLSQGGQNRGATVSCGRQQVFGCRATGKFWIGV
jgi:hypothetical protein